MPPDLRSRGHKNGFWRNANAKCPTCLTPGPTTNQYAPTAIQPEDIQMHAPPSLATTPSITSPQTS